MDQFRQIGEVVGSMKALMVLRHDILINQRQCCLLFDISVQAFDKISEQIIKNLRLDERSTKWKPLERPLRELHGIFKEGELYIKNCVDIKNWFGKAINLHLNRDCVEFHIHNLFSCFVVVIEAIEAAAEISGLDEEDMHKRRLSLLKKYDPGWSESKIFQWKYGKQYLVPREISSRLDNVWKEDKWLLLDMLKQKKQTKLVEELMRKLDGIETNPKLLPNSILLETSDYYVKRRIGTAGSHLKEIQWLGENFALRTFYGDIETLRPEISMVMSLSHPNVLQYHIGFYDEERKEGFLVMELMSKSLDIFVKENTGQKRRMSFSIPVAVDVMLQIARGMEYLHGRSIYHGELNPSNILLKPTNSSTTESYFHAKVAGFGLSLLKSQYTYRSCAVDPVIWYAPEVLAEQEQHRSNKCIAKCSEKADVYSFAMLCYHILTGKVPFEEGERPLQGDKMVHYLMAGERPLFSHPLPKYLINLIRKCWQTPPHSRPSFSSISRILRYIKKVLVINPEHGQPDCPPLLVDYCDIEARYAKKFNVESNIKLLPKVSEIPFQMFAYKVVENEKSLGNGGFAVRQRSSNDLVAIDDLCIVPNDGTYRGSFCSEIIDRNDLGTFADQSSVMSEIPHSKLFDNISNLSDNLIAADESPAFADSPDWKLLTALPVDPQSSPRVETPGRKILSSSGSTKKLKFSGNLERVISSKRDVEEKELPSKSKVQQKVVFSEPMETKHSANDQKTTLFESPKKPFATEAKSRSSEALEKRPSSANGQKPRSSVVHSESTRKKFMRSITKFRLTKIPEKKTLNVPNSQCADSPENPHKATTQPSKPKLSLKNAIFHNNLKGKQSCNEAGKPKYQSPRASPARVLTRTTSVGPFSSPPSSPLYPSFKAGSSPARGPPTRAWNNAGASPNIRGIKDKNYMSPLHRHMKAPI